MTRAIYRFIARASRFPVVVRVLPCAAAVDAEYRESKRPRRRGKVVPAFFDPATAPNAKHIGTIVIAGNERLSELVPHEVDHAATHRAVTVHRDDDEAH